jgi:Peptidase family S41
MVVAESSPLSASPLLADVVAAAEPLTFDERRQIVRTAELMIEQVYVHLPLKRAMHAVDPIQRLRLLDRRLKGFTDRRFQDEMISIFIGLRDLHTNYMLPAPYAGRTAALPFRIESFWEGDKRKYLVTGVIPALVQPPFDVGVEVTHWNGVPIDRAVDLNGDHNAGSNVDARHERGLASLTQRLMTLLAPPDEEWVEVTFLAEGAEHEQRFDWRVIEPAPPATGEGASPLADAVAGSTGLDLLTEEIRRVQKTLFATEAIELEQAMAAGADEAPSEQLAEVSTLPDVFQFRSVPGPDGDLGYLRIRTFSVKVKTAADLDRYVDEAVRILGLLPQDGLIIDVRGNGGGVIACGEMLLQLLTPQQIEPERLHFINTPFTLEVTSQPAFAAWHESIDESIETGATFSDGLPLADGYPELCNKLGQRYYGPVVLITDALCYSTTDIFAAGFQDHEIGPVIGTSGNTGAGGANVLDYSKLMDALPNHFTPLPKQASMRVAFRRTTRVGARTGDTLEDLGVVSNRIHKMTKRDLLESNVDLIAEAAQVLSTLPHRAFVVEETPHAGGIDLKVRTKGLDRLDVLVDGRPRNTLDIEDGEHSVSVALAEAGQHAVELRGFDAGELAAARKLQVGS